MQRIDQWINKIQRFKPSGNAGRGRLPKSRKDGITEDLKFWMMPVNVCQDCDGCRRQVYNFMGKSQPWFHG